MLNYIIYIIYKKAKMIDASDNIDKRELLSELEFLLQIYTEADSAEILAYRARLGAKLDRMRLKSELEREGDILLGDLHNQLLDFDYTNFVMYLMDLDVRLTKAMVRRAAEQVRDEIYQVLHDNLATDEEINRFFTRCNGHYTSVLCTQYHWIAANNRARRLRQQGFPDQANGEITQFFLDIDPELTRTLYNRRQEQEQAQIQIQVTPAAGNF